MQSKITAFRHFTCRMILMFSLAGLLTGLPYNSYSQDSLSLFEYVNSLETMIDTIRLDTDWGQLVGKKNKEEYQPARLWIRGPNKEEIELELKVRARGNVRKQVCFFPPVLLNFRDDQLRENGFLGYDKLKMVIQCRSGDVGQDYLFRELLAYRLFNIISPIAYQVKPIVLDCYDEGKQDKFLFAFLLEEEEEYGDRTSSRIVESGMLSSGALDRESYLKMCFFQYMIGNTDWSIPNMHNLEMTKQEDKERVVPVAYDFDYSGLVGASYAIPAAGTPISNVRQRHFQGVNVREGEAVMVAKYFLQIKDSLLEECFRCPILEEKEKSKIADYLEEFFKILEDENRVKKIFTTVR